ncbi:sorting nexin-6, partial [Clarias magur]
QEGLDDGPDFLSEEDRGPRAVNVDLQTDATLQVDISDALSERDKVKFTVHTKSTLPNFKQNEFSVVRQHEEFIWLHDSFVENEEYAGFIIPPAPPRPDFDASREKLQKLGEGEGSMTKEEFTKMKQELEAEYLAIFKKTVAMHEVFLCRVAAHPVLRKDLNFHVFLEYNQDLSVRGKNKKEKLEDFFKNVVKSADGVLVAGVKDVDDFFEHEKTFLLEYHNRVKDASMKSDRMIRSHKSAAEDINRIASTLYTLGTQDSTDMCKFFLKVSELFEKTRKIEARVAADEDLKLADLLKYYLRESQAAKDLLYRRGRALVDYENANKALDKARAKNKDVLQAETTQQVCCQKFEKISESAKQVNLLPVLIPAQNCSEDELDILLNGTPDQKKKLIREYLTGESESSSGDEFEKEMEAELSSTIKSMECNWTAPSTQGETSRISGNTEGAERTQQSQQYDDIYFDTDSDEDSQAGISQIQRKKQRQVRTNDELLYDPDEDDRDQAWVDAKRKEYRYRSRKRPASSGQRTNQSQALPSSDAILNCPACMTTLCLDCQRHEKYRTQYRAMFVMNCSVNKDEVLRYKAAKQKKQRRKKSRQDHL